MTRERRQRALRGLARPDRTGRVDEDRNDQMLALLAATSTGERRRAIPLATAFGHAQRTVGNAAVQRLVNGTPLPVQRWAMKLPSTASCNEVSHYLQTKSPYKPMAALTKAAFTRDPTFEVSGKKPKYVVTITDANVELTTSVDMPEWAPVDGPMKRSWAKGVRELRDHEGEHEDVAEKAKTSMTKTLEAMKMTVIAKSPAAAEAGARKLEKKQWIALLKKHAKAQKKLDPFYTDIC